MCTNTVVGKRKKVVIGDNKDEGGDGSNDDNSWVVR